MAKDGLRVFDSDMHVIEPPDLWQRYMDPSLREQASDVATGVHRPGGRPNGQCPRVRLAQRRRD